MKRKKIPQDRERTGSKQLPENRYIEISAVILALALAILPQWQLWITNEAMAVHDTMRLFPMWAYFADCLQKGILPLWDPYLETGQPFFIISPGMTWAWYPWTFMLILMGKLAGTPLISLFHYNLLAMYLILITGTYALFRHLSTTKAGAFCGFLAVTMSSLGISYMWQSGYLGSIFAFPWIALYFFKFLETAKPVYLAVFLFIFAIAAQSYHIMFSVTVLGILLICVIACKSIPSLTYHKLLPGKKILFACLGVFFAIVIKNAAEALYLGDMTLIQRTDVSSRSCAFISDILILFAPYYERLFYYHSAKPVISEAVIYIGLVPLFFAVIGIFFSEHRYKRPILITTVLVLFLMLGPNSPAFALLKYIPSFLIIRNTAEFHAFLLVFIGFFVCAGADALIKMTREDISPTRMRNILLAGLSFVICTGIIIAIPLLPNYPIRPNAEALAMLDKTMWANIRNLLWFTVALTALIWFIKQRKTSAILAAFIVFSATDLIVLRRVLFDHYTQRRDIYAQTMLTNSLPPFQYDKARTPYVNDDYLMNIPALIRIPSAYHKHTRYGSHFLETKDFSDFMYIGDHKVMDIAAGVNMAKLRIVDQAVVMERSRIKDEIKKVDPEAFRNFIFIEKPLPKGFQELTRQEKSENIADSSAKVTLFEPNQCHMEVTCEKNCLLYYSDGYDKAWRAFVDNKETYIYKANLAFKAIPLKPGKHDIRFVYDPIFFKITVLLYFIGLLAGTGLIAGLVWKKRA
ncbi:YfhO family protein [Elusimicrobiota bacterium]